jgi:hypothetical protein
MKDSASKKAKHEKKRKDAAKERRKTEEKRDVIKRRRQEYEDEYPQFQFKDEHLAAVDFVKLIKQTISQLSFEDEVFQPSDRKLLKYGKAHGFAKAMELLNRSDAARIGSISVNEFEFKLKVGQVVFSRIPQQVLKGYIPMNNVEIMPLGKQIIVKFRALLHRRGSHGTIYYSRHLPTLLIDGEHKIVGFSKHALDKTCERLDPSWWTYAGLGDVFAFFDQCIYFERAKLFPDQLAFTFFDFCPKGFWRWQYVEQILGDSKDFDGNRSDYYFRVGYCPAGIEDDFIVAITLLFPGFTKTPEFGKLLQASLPFSQRRQMIDLAKQQTAAYLMESNDFSLLKWFHCHGVEQVVCINQQVYVSVL